MLILQVISSKWHSFYHIKAESGVSLSGLFQLSVNSSIIFNIPGLLKNKEEERAFVGKLRPINATKGKNSSENIYQQMKLHQLYGD